MNHRQNMSHNQTAHGEPFLEGVVAIGALDSRGVLLDPRVPLALSYGEQHLRGVEHYVATMAMGGTFVDLWRQRDSGLWAGRPGYEAERLAVGPNILGRRAIGSAWDLPSAVSREHAVVVDSGKSVWVRDNASLNGTRLYVPGAGIINQKRPEREANHGIDAGVAEKTRRGREVSEDRSIVKLNHGLFGVFDGVGGEWGGAAAADMAFARLNARIQRAPTDAFRQTAPHLAEEWLRETLDSISQNISEHAGVGFTTATVARVVDSHEGQVVVWASIGDSRLYHVRDGRAKQVTVDEGEGRFLARCLGNERPWDRNIQQTGRIVLKPGEKIVLVTDGITGDYGDDLMRETELYGIVHGNSSAQHAAKELVNQSRKNDDGTAVVICAR